MDRRDVLEKLCRVCSRQVVTKSSKVKHLCSDYKGQLQAVFTLSTSSDDVDSHPKFFCHSCKIVLFKATSAVTPYQHRTVIFEGWCSHTNSSCTVCRHYQSIQLGGRPKKVKRTAGRPPSVSPRYCIDHVCNVAPVPLAPHTDINVCKHHQNLLPEFKCPICNEIFRCPIEIVTCSSVLCAECMCKWLQYKEELVCPCCYSDHLKGYTTGIREATLLRHLLGSLCVICSTCNGHVKLDGYNDHVKTCTTSLQQLSPSTSIDDVLQRPLTSPLTPMEQKLQTSLVRRSMSGSPEESVLQLKTGGKVSIKRTCWIPIHVTHTIFHSQ